MSRAEDNPGLFIERLRANPFFESLNEEALAFLSTRTRQSFHEAGEMIFMEGDPSGGLYWLHSGALKAVKYAESGREQILHLIYEGETFNEVGCFSKQANPVSVIVLEPSQVWRIPGEAIRNLIERDPVFAQQVIDILSVRLRNSVALVEDLSLRPVISRLARLILDESDGNTLFRPVWYTQNELAARLGTVADVIQRSLRKLESDSVIEVGRQQIRIVDREQLSRLAA